MAGLELITIVAALAVLSALKVSIQSAACRKYVHSTDTSVLYNAAFFAFVAIFVAVIFRPSYFTWEIFFYAFAASVTTLMFQITYSVALTSGPVSLTVLLINLNIIIPTVVSVIAYNEKVYLSQIIGMVFLVGALILSVGDMSDSKNGTFKWLALAVTALISCGASTCVQKFFSVRSSEIKADTSSSYLLLVYAIGTAVSLLIFAALGVLKKKKAPDEVKVPRKLSLRVLPYAGICGLVLCIYQKLNVYTLSKIDGIIIFPTLSGASMLLMTIIGILLFKDRLDNRQKFGMVCGILSIVLMNLKF